MANERKLNGSPSLNKEYYYYYIEYTMEMPRDELPEDSVRPKN